MNTVGGGALSHFKQLLKTQNWHKYAIVPAFIGFPAATAYAAAFRGFPGFPAGLLTGYTSGRSPQLVSSQMEIEDLVGLYF